MRKQKFLNVVLVERKACCHVANAFLNRLQQIWLLSRLKMSKLSEKNAFLPKALVLIKFNFIEFVVCKKKRKEKKIASATGAENRMISQLMYNPNKY